MADPVLMTLPSDEWLASMRYRYLTDADFHAAVEVIVQERLREGPMADDPPRYLYNQDHDHEVMDPDCLKCWMRLAHESQMMAARLAEMRLTDPAVISENDILVHLNQGPCCRCGTEYNAVPKWNGGNVVTLWVPQCHCADDVVGELFDRMTHRG